jgi:hypothetical protein
MDGWHTAPSPAAGAARRESERKRIVKNRKRTVRHRRRATVTAAAIALLAGVLLAPSSALAFEKGFWGPTTKNGVNQFPIYKDLGVTLYQTALPWASIAPTRPANPRDPADPAYQWPADVDFALQQSRANNMKVLLMLVGSPPWANGGRSQLWAPTNPSDFADFASAAAKRYPTVRMWMIWGEPTQPQRFMPFVAQKKLGQALTPRQKEAPRRYARILDASYGALKAVNRRNLVVGGNTSSTGEIRPIRWIQNLKLANGRPPRMDLYGHNPFSYRNPDLKNPQSDLELVDFSDLARFKKKIAKYLARPRNKSNIRIFLSEFAVPTDKPDQEFNFYVTRAVQAKWLRNGFRVARQVGAYGLGWIHLYDDAPDPTRQVIQSGLLTWDGQRKPGYFAFKNG